MIIRFSTYIKIGIFIHLIKENIAYSDWNHHRSRGGAFMSLKDKSEPKDDNKNESSYLEDCSVCGVTHTSDDEGNSSDPIKPHVVKPYYRYPWVAGLLDYMHYSATCMVSILSKDYVITAAHCVETIGVEKREGNICKDANNRTLPCFRDPLEFRIRRLTKSKEYYTADRIEKIIPHPKFDGTNPIYDISLLKFEKPIKCNKFSSPICLPPSDFEIDAKREYYLTANEELLVKEAKVKSTSPSICMSKLRELRPVQFNVDEYDFYCMRSVGNLSACKGDSGTTMFGPIFNDGRMYALAVFSGHTCEFCSLTEPIFLVALPYHFKWIQKVTGLKPPEGSQSFISEMKTEICGPNEEYIDCMNPCNDCINKGVCSELKIFYSCKAGCDCHPGYRRYMGKCIPEADCFPNRKPSKDEFRSKKRRSRSKACPPNRRGA